MVMIAAGGVEREMAAGALGVGFEVGGDGEFSAAGAAEDGGFVPLGLGPEFDGVSC